VGDAPGPRLPAWSLHWRTRISAAAVLPSADTAAMLFWALLASGQITMRKVDGWQTLAAKPIDQPIDLAA
jgi:putative transposase